MNIVVCAKQVVDVSEIKLDPSTKRPVLTGIAKKISDIDKNAMEEAIKMKEKVTGRITVLTVGTPDAKERIKELLAMGADEGIVVAAPADSDYATTASLIVAAIKKLGHVDAILCGEASIDLFSGQMGPRVAGLLDIPQLTYATKVTPEKDKVTVERNLGDQAVTETSTYPVLITVTKEINTPRLPSLMQILSSSSKPIKEWKAEELAGGPLTPKIKTVEIKGVPMSRKNIVYQDDLDASINKLIGELAKEGVLR
jgi:electron transfer flavoprotein beta subunit